MIHTVRYFLGVVTIIIVPAGVLFWLVIHPWARWWRKLGLITYLIVIPPLVVLGRLIYRVRAKLLGADLGTNWTLIGIALVLSCAMTWLESQYWKQLSIATLVGIPELSLQRPGKLLREGIYAKVRHPRYLSAGIGLLVNAFFINYAGLYIIVAVTIPIGYLILALEERELVDRFGEAYRVYQREVPQLIPRLRRGR